MSIEQRYALLSVSDRQGIGELARGLADLRLNLIATGGTAQFIRENGVPCMEVQDITGFPEILDGRVKTLHPNIHGGIAAVRSNPDHLATIHEHGIELIDLVVCNLYPFVQKPSIETIDIGGVTLIRAAAKNYAAVGVVVSPDDYDQVLAEVREDVLSDATRLLLAQKAFDYVMAYDTAIAEWLKNRTL